MVKIIVRTIQVKGAPGQSRRQLVDVRTVDWQGNKVVRECWIPVDRHQEPYAVGVYTLSPRSVYVDRHDQGLKLFPRLEWVRGLLTQAAPDAVQSDAAAFCNSP